MLVSRIPLLARLLGKRRGAEHSEGSAPRPGAGSPGADPCPEFGLDVGADSAAAVRLPDGTVRPAGTYTGANVHGPYVHLRPAEVLEVPAVCGHAELAFEVCCSADSPQQELRVEAVVDGALASIATLSAPDSEAAGMPTPRTFQITVPSREPLQLRVLAPASNRGAVRLHRLLVAPRHRLGRANAFAGYESRLGNELQHFGAASYKHPMYGDGEPAAAQGGERGGTAHQFARGSSGAASVRAMASQAAVWTWGARYGVLPLSMAQSTARRRSATDLRAWPCGLPRARRAA